MTPLHRSGPAPRRGKRRIVSLPGVVKGVELRSQLEVWFAEELERRGIRWLYEPERIGAGHYLVDFYLPDLHTWVEIKGRYEFRDDLLLPNVAANLKRDRGERLFLVMGDQAYWVKPKTFVPLTHEEFWKMLHNPPGELDLW